MYSRYLSSQLQPEPYTHIGTGIITQSMGEPTFRQNPTVRPYPWPASPGPTQFSDIRLHPGSDLPSFLDVFTNACAVCIWVFLCPGIRVAGGGGRHSCMCVVDVGRCCELGGKCKLVILCIQSIKTTRSPLRLDVVTPPSPHIPKGVIPPPPRAVFGHFGYPVGFFPTLVGVSLFGRGGGVFSPFWRGGSHERVRFITPFDVGQRQQGVSPPQPT